jgi:hypothetical protein
MIFATHEKLKTSPNLLQDLGKKIQAPPPPPSKHITVQLSKLQHRTLV